MYLFSYGIVHVVVFTIDYCHVFVFITNTFLIGHCSGADSRGGGLWGLQPPAPIHTHTHTHTPPSNKSSTYINIPFTRLVNVTIWLLNEWFRSAW